MQENSQYSEWLEKINKAAGITEDAIVKEVKKEEQVVEKTIKNPKTWRNFLISLGIFLLAILPRFYFIFFISGTQNAGVGWYNDSYHHWQIAYLTQQIGLHKGFLRLWDLQGLEYFWGFLHPFILATLFAITGSADILISRLFNIVISGATAVVLFWLVKKYFNKWTAIASIFLFIINPIGIITDSSGMQEPLGIFLLILGLYFWPIRGLLTGIFWALASMTRAEYWLFSIELLGIILLFDENKKKKTSLFTSYSVLILLYMKYLLDKTGNALYPIYWNFLGNAAGKWEKDIPLTTVQMDIRVVFGILLVMSIGGLIVILRRRPRLYLFSALGLSNFIFLALFIGFTAYLKSYLPRFWVDRIFLLPYIWLSFGIVATSLFYLPKYVKKVGYFPGWILVGIVAILVQYTWIPINYYRLRDLGGFLDDISTAKQVAKYYQSGFSILIPGNDPIFTYALYKNRVIGKDIRGEMFDPYFYIPGNPYQNWSQNRKIVLDFFRKENIHLLLFTNDEKRYVQLVTLEKNSFRRVLTIRDFQLYEVNL